MDLLAIGMVKLSLLLFFRRIFMGNYKPWTSPYLLFRQDAVVLTLYLPAGRGQRTVFDISNWTLITVNILWTLISVLITIFECGSRPDGAWSGLAALRGKCMNVSAMNTALAVSSWILDVSILIEPLLMV